MRRQDREITDKRLVLDLLESFNTLRLGLFDVVYPYIVPVNFALDREKEETVLYFHTAKEGKKAELLKSCGRVCVEADRDAGFLALGENRGMTTRYESVIGFGVCEEVFEKEKLHGLRLLLKRAGFEQYDAAACGSLAFTAVYKITLSELTAKQNRMPGEFEA